MKRCTDCGQRTRVQDRCYECRTNDADAGLSDGEWVKRPGSPGIYDFVPASPVLVAPDPEPVVESWHTLPHEFCEDCAALLLPGEWCPCSRLWARAAEVEHSWSPIPLSGAVELAVAA